MANCIQLVKELPRSVTQSKERTLKAAFQVLTATSMKMAVFLRMVEALSTPETSVKFYKTTRHYSFYTEGVGEQGIF
jgi:hypothetical protein